MAELRPAKSGIEPAQVRNWPDLLTSLIRGEDVSEETTAWAMDEMMTGAATPVQMAGFLVALRAKGETVAEVAGLVRSMYGHATTIEVPGETVDIVGTGGDRAKTVNISTMSAIVAAGAGARVVKHGNRAASSRSGATDVLEKLGVNLAVPAEKVAGIAVEAGITYCPAPVFHPSMRNAGPARGGLGVPTVFNFLGPLTNPAQPESAAIGVADAGMADLIAHVLAGRGIGALVFRGETDGLDELAPTGPSRIWEVRSGAVTQTVVDWADLGVRPIQLAEIRGADAAHNAEVARRVLAGESGPVRLTVLLNAAAGLVADGTLTGTGTLLERLAAGVALAEESIDSGAAAAVLERWRAASAA
jgi:anthranilate phosphoribosyltransferase